MQVFNERGKYSPCHESRAHTSVSQETSHQGGLLGFCLSSHSLLSFLPFPSYSLSLSPCLLLSSVCFPLSPLTHPLKFLTLSFTPSVPGTAVDRFRKLLWLPKRHTVAGAGGKSVEGRESERERERVYVSMCVWEREVEWSDVKPQYRTSLYKLLYSNTHSSFLTSMSLGVLSHLKKII